MTKKSHDTPWPGRTQLVLLLSGKIQGAGLFLALVFLFVAFASGLIFLKYCDPDKCLGRVQSSDSPLSYFEEKKKKKCYIAGRGYFCKPLPEK